MKDTIFTGVEDWRLTVSDALMERTTALRNKASGIPAEDALTVRRLIVGEVSALSGLTDDESVTDGELCERVIAQRGKPYSEAPLRRKARERARVWLLLSGEPRVPETPDELLTFFETANRSEPHFCRVIPASFRTADNGIPFTLGRSYWERNPSPPPGRETVPGERVPDETRRLLDFINRRDIPAEWRALAAHFLLIRIHPFRNGNGHTARMLAVTLLSPYYRGEQLIKLIIGFQENKELMIRAFADTQIRHADISYFIDMVLPMVEKSILTEP